MGPVEYNREDLVIQNDCQIEAVVPLKEKTLRLKINAVFKKNNQDQTSSCTLEGNCRIENGDGTVNNIKLPLKNIKPGQTVIIGGWEKIFEKKNVSCNISPDITTEELSNLANQTLMTMTGASNGVVLSTDCMNITLIKKGKPDTDHEKGFFKTGKSRK